MMKTEPEDDAEAHHKRQRLLLLRHATMCKADDGKCTVTPHCADTKELWKHMAKCKDRCCKIRHCTSSQYVLGHYRRCKPPCSICDPVKAAMEPEGKKSCTMPAKSHCTTGPPVVVVHDSLDDACEHDDDDDDDTPPEKKRAKTKTNANGSEEEEKNKNKNKIIAPHPPPSGGGRSFRPESRTLLDDMLHPMTVSDFLNVHFRNNAVHVDRRHLSRRTRESLVREICEDHLFDLDVGRIFEETSSESVFLWLRPPPSSSSSSSPSPCPLDSVEVSDPVAAHKLHVSGSHPAYCRAPPRLERLLVSSLLRSTGLGGGHYQPPHREVATLGGGTTLGRGEVELFVGTTTSSSTTPPRPPPSARSGRKAGIEPSGGGVGGGGGGGGGEKFHATGWHTDFQENFTIQLTGTKRWTLRRGRVRHPLRGTTPHFARDCGVVENQLKAARLCRPSEGDDDDATSSSSSSSSSSSLYHDGGYGFEYDRNNAVGPEMTVTLRPGDVLYFPAGMWHRVETLEHGISLNVSLMGTTYARLVCEALQHLLLGSDDDGWREVVSSRPTTTGGWGGGAGGGDGGTTGRLGELLAGLGRLVDDFVENGGGARSLMPPALCHPPSPLSDHEDDGGASEGEDGSGSSDGEGEVDDEDNDGVGPSSSSGIVVRMDDFVGPPCWNSSRPPKSKLARNPLATLIAMSDIAGHNHHQQHHQILNGKCNGDEWQHEHATRQYVLNVNFAGNEMMESHVRVILETSEPRAIKQMEYYLACEQRGTDPGLLSSDPKYANVSADDTDTPLCLFYYGYFVWV